MGSKEEIIKKILESDLSPEDKKAFIDKILTDKPNYSEFVQQLVKVLGISKELIRLFGLNDGCD